jgi:hypothetical protein
MGDHPTPSEDKEFQRLVRFIRTSAQQTAGGPPTESPAAAAAGGSVRGHVHNLVDLSAEMVGVLAAIGRVVKERWAASTVDAVSRVRPWPPSAAAAGAGTGLGVVFDPVPAGGTTTTRVSIVNDGTVSAAMTLRCTDLSGGATGRIPATAVTVEPQQVDVPAKGTVAVVLTIDVPSGTRPGLYAGFLQQAGNPTVRTTVGVEVR